MPLAHYKILFIHCFLQFANIFEKSVFKFMKEIGL